MGPWCDSLGGSEGSEMPAPRAKRENQTQAAPPQSLCARHTPSFSILTCCTCCCAATRRRARARLSCSSLSAASSSSPTVTGCGQQGGARAWQARVKKQGKARAGAQAGVRHEVGVHRALQWQYWAIITPPRPLHPPHRCPWLEHSAGPVAALHRRFEARPPLCLRLAYCCLCFLPG